MHKSFDMHNKLRFFVHDNINIHKKQPKFEYKGYIEVLRIYAIKYHGKKIREHSHT